MDLEREEKEAFDEEVEHEKKKKFMSRKKNETARKNENENGDPDPSNEIDDLEDEAPYVDGDSNLQSRKRKVPSGDSNLVKKEKGPLR